ncbi:type I restriction enzyme HsdR N-terminal domain-containing protein [Frigoriflavimonas asaccharolytica]|uniref:Type I restriction enzyme R protein N-terminal domain-containing protein n=1 Tax=Frigoriflavimonas asaccharolytica TaxID=2735899 RepID=A0A8J8KBZ1_9FLAO|nr:type I restriction enzyme HsdR N-terminal domain-containing protein [Frigoriflavimonas asaccharolytica]NRS93064.1 hypothetical protein [Frigoriflavimonas asaccharolytica]
MELPKLNFSANFDFKLKKNKDKIFIYDLVRKNWFLLTPEEWVRQHWILYFLKIKNYAASALIVEKKIEINNVTKRLDLLITEKTKPIILIECKAPNIKLTEKTFEQTARYNSIVCAEEIILSNGIQHITAKFIDENYIFEPKEF